jgi:hypothetical protein
MNTIVVIEDRTTKRSYECEPYPMGTALDIQCPCGAYIHPIVGAWCRKCGAKVVQVPFASNCYSGDIAVNERTPDFWHPV